MKTLTFLLAFHSVLHALDVPFGTPACAGPELEQADRRFYVVCYDYSLKAPRWVAEVLKPEYLNAAARRPSHFRRDWDLSRPTATSNDFKGSGFVRGHLAPARDFAWSEEAIQSTFLYTNAIPQYPGVNSGRWAQLERRIRELALDFDYLVVHTGILCEPSCANIIGPGRVAVPTHMFKAVLAVRGSHLVMFAFIVPNSEHVSEPLSYFVTTVDDVERRTGLDLFADLDDTQEQPLESATPGKAAATSESDVSPDHGRRSAGSPGHRNGR